MQFIEGIRDLSASELGMLGMADVAYIKPVVILERLLEIRQPHWLDVLAR